MGLKIVVVCDGLGCKCEEEVDEPTKENIEMFEWFCDPHDSAFHYCPKCKYAAKAEIEAEPYVEM
ncbi:hypothetical protein A3715_31745 [Oleiphilus sp. HI0009]|nr:hypothetical protein A3715_10380 [Oleiphilus sp. HI0009]KZX83604.1 hypothetical protein A3715_31745 [Oleiphilus sp. HI0009]